MWQFIFDVQQLAYPYEERVVKTEDFRVPYKLILEAKLKIPTFWLSFLQVMKEPLLEPCLLLR